LIPQKLDDWTYQLVNELVNKNVGESYRHDFKADIPDSDSLTAICCSFANTDGGFIVLGVSENNAKWKIKGIDNDKEIAHRFGQKINADPTIQFDLPKIIPITNSTKVLAVFHIPKSSERPHIPSVKEKRTFWKRTNKGKDYMTYQEIRMSFQNYEERREKVKLLHNELLINAELLESMKSADVSQMNPQSLLTLDSIVITNLLTDLYTIIGKDHDLVKSLNTIRVNIRIINNKISHFLSQAALPLSNSMEITRHHNEFLNDKAQFLIPIIYKAIQIIEQDFGLKNPSL
jgi:Putative DNA-binding domain